MKRFSTSGMTAAAVLILGIAGGVVGGMMAVSPAAVTPPTISMDRTNQEGAVVEPTPDVDSLESELGYPVESAEPMLVAPQPVQVPSPAPIVQGESASGAADRATVEADRSEAAADRAETASIPKPTPAPAAPIVEVPAVLEPAPTPTPKPECEAGEQMATPGAARPDGSASAGTLRTCVNGEWGAPTPDPKNPARPAPSKPSDPGSVSVAPSTGGGAEG